MFIHITSKTLSPPTNITTELPILLTLSTTPSLNFINNPSPAATTAFSPPITLPIIATTTASHSNRFSKAR